MERSGATCCAFGRRGAGAERGQWPLELFGKPALGERPSRGIVDRDVGDVTVHGETRKGPLDLRLVLRRQSGRRKIGEHRQHDAPLRANLLLDVAPFLPGEKRRNRDGGERDQSHRQQIELGQEPHPYRGQIEGRDSVGRQRRQVFAKTLADGGHRRVAVRAVKGRRDLSDVHYKQGRSESPSRARKNIHCCECRRAHTHREATSGIV
jgi:hypothetical protein